MAGGVGAAVRAARETAARARRSRSSAATPARSTRRSRPAPRACCSTTWSRPQLRAIVAPRGRPREARGQRRRDLETVREIAATGVEFVSVGALTHSAPALDLSLLLEPRHEPPHGHRGDPRGRAAAQPEDVAELQAEVRALARERDAIILAHNYQLPEVQDVADYVGDSLGLSQRAAASTRPSIAFCGVHFMAETASILCPDKTVLIPDLGRGLLAGRLDHPRAAARLAGAAPRRDHGHVRQHDGRDQGADRLLRDLLERRRGRRAHPARARRGHRDPLRPGHVPGRLRREVDRAGAPRLGRRVPRPRRASARATSRACAASTPAPTSSSTPSAAARRRSWSTWPPATSTPRACTCCPRAGWSSTRAQATPGSTAVMATETGMLHQLRMAAPDVDCIAANEARHLPLHEDDHAAQAARLPARPQRRGEGARGRRRARPGADRAHGRHRVTTTFAGGTLDRAGARRADPAWVAERLAEPSARAVVGGVPGVLVAGDEPALVPLGPLLAARRGGADPARARGRRPGAPRRGGRPGRPRSRREPGRPRRLGAALRDSGPGRRRRHGRRPRRGPGRGARRRAARPARRGRPPRPGRGRAARLRRGDAALAPHDAPLRPLRRGHRARRRRLRARAARAAGCTTTRAPTPS